MNHTIRYYQPQDREEFRRFINNHWRENHIIATSDVVFNFQHKLDNYYSFVVAINNTTGEIDSVFGYISTHKYDSTHQLPKVLWGAIWKTKETPECIGLGIALLRYIIREEKGMYATIGISDIAKKLYKQLGYEVGQLMHYYVANPFIDAYHIAISPIKKQYNSDTKIETRYIDIEKCEKITNSLNPYKNICYFRNRYKCHPIYDYRFLGVYDLGELQLIIVIRKQRVGTHSCLRIVDMMGNAEFQSSILSNLQKLLVQEKAEYIDCWNHGVPSDYFITLGFEQVGGETIIPDYFAPFEKRNIDLAYTHMKSDRSLIIFKGDGDQDRPNCDNKEYYED